MIRVAPSGTSVASEATASDETAAEISDEYSELLSCGAEETVPPPPRLSPGLTNPGAQPASRQTDKISEVNIINTFLIFMINSPIQTKYCYFRLKIVTLSRRERFSTGCIPPNKPSVHFVGLRIV